MPVNKGRARKWLALRNRLLILASIGLGSSLLSQSTFAYSNYISTMVGGGYAFADRKGTKLQTFQNFGMVRLAYDLNMKYPFFVSADLETFRIQRQEEALPRHHYGEGGGISLGARHQPYGFWIQFTMGRLRNLYNPPENYLDRAQRYRYHSTSFGVSYSIYQREYSAIDIQAVSKLITTERGWKQTYNFKNIHLASLLLSFTLLEL